MALHCIASTNEYHNCHVYKSDNDILCVYYQLMQYSKFNNPDFLVRDVTSTAQAICVENLVSGYFNHPNVTLYLSVIIILPISTFIVGTSTICLYYDSINKKVQDVKQRPHIVGAAVTGFYIVIYIMISDITAVYYYIQGWDEYSFNSTLHNSFQLKLTWVTVLIEYSMSILALLVCIGFIVCKDWHYFRDRSYHTIKHQFPLLHCGLYGVFIILTMISLLFMFIAIIYALDMSIKEKQAKTVIILLSSGLLFLILLSYFWLSKGKTVYLISFMVIPAIFTSAHLGYIFAAWLTEPSKTTSVSILALSIVLYLFIISRLVYEKVRTLFSIFTKSERVILFVTVIIVFFGVSFVALNVSALYNLPVPALQLADYLENIFQISLVIFAALISYKILIQEDSEAKKFFKKFNKVFKNDTPFQALKVGTQSKQNSNNLSLDEKEARLCGKLVWGELKISDTTLKRRYVTCEIEDAALIVQFKGHGNSKKSVKIEVKNVNMNLGFISSKTQQVRIPLSETKLSFELVSSNGNEKVTVPVTKACIGYNSVPASEYELHILCKEREPPVVSLTRAALSCVSEGINICKPNEFKILKVPLKCFITKTRSGRPGEVYCLFDHFVSLVGKTDRSAKNLITWNAETINQQILPYSLVDIEISLCEDDNNFYDFKLMEIFQHRCALNMEIELKRQFLELRYSIVISDNNYPITIRHNTINDVAYLEVVYMNETVLLSVPALAKFTTVMLTRSRNNRIRYGNNHINVFGDYAIVQFVPGDGERYEIGSESIPTENHDNVPLISTEHGTKLVLSQMFGADTTIKVTQEKVEVDYKDEGTVKLIKNHDQEYKLELRKIEEDEYPSYLCIPNSEPAPTDVFENAGAAFGQIALAMSHDNN